jgi:hypothetical protein
MFIMRRFGWAEEREIALVERGGGGGRGKEERRCGKRDKYPSLQCRDKYVPTTTTVGLMQPESHGRHIRILS